MPLLAITAVMHFIAAAGSVISGLIATWAGLRGRRVGTTPYCSACDYNLTALVSDRCPECGQAINPGAIAVGERHRQPVLVASGIILILAGTLWTFGPIRKINWYRLYPNAWLMSELQSPTAVTAHRAFKELERRELAEKLPATLRSRLIDLCLREQVADPPGPIFNELMTYLGCAYIDGLLSASQKNLLHQQLVRLELRVRPKVLEGDKLPFVIIATDRSPPLPHNRSFMLEIKMLHTQIDQHPAVRMGSSMTSNLNRNNHSTLGTQVRLPPCPLGRHVLNVKADVSFFVNSNPTSLPEPSEASRIHQQKMTLTAPFELLATQSAGGLLRGIQNESLKEILLDRVRVRNLRYHNGILEGMVEVNSTADSLNRETPKVNLAFEVNASIAGKEHPLGIVCCTMKTGQSYSYGFSSQEKIPPPSSETCEIILRGSSQAARRSIDLFDYWDGELVFRDVPVSATEPDGSTASQPTTSLPDR